MDISRRAILKSTPVLTVGLAGCSNSNNDAEPDDVNQDTPRPDADNDGVPDVQDDYPNDSTRSEQLRSVSDARNIQEDHWYYLSFDFGTDGGLEYDFVVRDGPPIDVILIDESEYEYYKNSDRYEYYPDESTLDSVGDETEASVSPGSYRLIFDNSSRGSAAPPTNFDNDIVEVEFTIESYV